MTDTMRDEGSFQDSDFFARANGESAFCSALEELLNAVLTFSRNTAWKCRSNGHTDLSDETWDGPTGKLKKRLLLLSSWIFKMFDCADYSIYAG